MAHKKRGQNTLVPMRDMFEYSHQSDVEGKAECAPLGMALPLATPVTHQSRRKMRNTRFPQTKGKIVGHEV